MHSASKYFKTPILMQSTIIQSPEFLKCHITKPEIVAMCLKLPSDVVGEVMKTHSVDAALEAVISNWAEGNKKACRDNTVQAMGCMKNMTLAIPLAVEYGFGPCR